MNRGAITGLMLLLASCVQAGGASSDERPSHVPAPVESDDNASTAAAIELGRHLFYDPRLSGNGEQACSDCHRQELAFADDRALSIGSTGELGVLNAPSLVNAAYMHPLGWAKPSLSTIEEQLEGPLFGEDPVEMGITGNEELVLDRLGSEPRYRELVQAAYPDSAGELDLEHARLALASFVRSIVSFRAPFDSYLEGDLGAISFEAERGAELFFSDRLGCSRCHSGFNFTRATQSRESEGQLLTPYHNVGLYDLDGAGAYPSQAQGLIDQTGIARDMGRFRAPSLRNLAFTAPYMHDGSLQTLDEVLDHYQSEEAHSNPLRAKEIPRFELDQSERDALIAFLLSLSDSEVTTDPRFGNPWL